MLLMERIYNDLKAEALVETAEDFSQDWCRRSRSWFAVQKNSDSDLSAQAAIACLQTAQVKLALLLLRQKHLGSIVDLEIDTLRDVKASLEAYLQEQHSILSVVPANTPKPKML